MNGGLPTLVAMQQETRTIPVVFAQVIEVRLRGEKSVRVNRRQAEAGRQSHDCSPVNQGVGARQNDKTAIRLAGEVFDGAFELCRVAATNGNEGMANAGMTAWIAPNMPISDGEARSRMAAIRTM